LTIQRIGAEGGGPVTDDTRSWIIAAAAPMLPSGIRVASALPRARSLQRLDGERDDTFRIGEQVGGRGEFGQPRVPSSVRR
jgi:hypothetical protein